MKKLTGKNAIKNFNSLKEDLFEVALDQNPPTKENADYWLTYFEMMENYAKTTQRLINFRLFG